MKGDEIMKQFIYKFFRNNKNKFRTKLTICFLICAIIPILFIGTASYLVATNIAKEKILDSVSLSGSQVTTVMDNRMSQIENVADSVHFYLYTLYQTPSEPLSSYMNQFDSVRNTITSLANAFDLYHISVFLDPSQFVSKEGIHFMSFDQLQDYGLAKEDLTGLGVSPKWVFHKNIEFPYVVSKNTPSDYILGCYRSFGASPGALDYAYGIYLPESELSDILNASYQDSQVNAYIMKKDGTVIAGRNPSNIGVSLPFDTLETYLSADSDAAFSYEQKQVILKPFHNEWYLVTEIPDSYILANTRPLVNVILMSLIVIIIVTLLAVMFISKELTRKLDYLSSAMEEVEISKNTESEKLLALLPPDPEKCDEIDRLAVQFDEMLHTLGSSFNEILSLSVKEEQLNYHLLQSQINPHFLYNMLASIRTLLSLGKLTTADKMLTDLSKFYRSILHKSTDLIPIRQELEIATLYMEMESLCRDGSFTWDIHLDEEIENFLICKFTLQPILENSILHGFCGGSTSMHIQITVTYDDDNILIMVKDNGIGIEPLKLRDIQMALKEKIVKYDKHFGISNINARISSALQEYGSIDIDSTLSKGTVVKITIPQILAEE